MREIARSMHSYVRLPDGSPYPNRALEEMYCTNLRWLEIRHHILFSSIMMIKRHSTNIRRWPRSIMNKVMRTLTFISVKNGAHRRKENTHG